MAQDDERVRIARQGFEDPVFFARFFLPHWFPDKVPWFHRGIMAVVTRQTEFLKKYGELDKIFAHFRWSSNIEDPKARTEPVFEWADDGRILLHVGRFWLIFAPRGFSKTTLENMFVLREVVYQNRKFPVYLSEGGTHAEMQLNNVKGELETNERIHSVFGNVVPERSSALKWTDSFIETTTGVTVTARGRGAQVRGLLNKGNRPDLILLDDVEDKESVKTPEQRAKVRQWMYGTVIPALPRRNSDASIGVLGTLLHAESLMMRLAQDPRFQVMRFSAVNKEGEALWPEHMSLEELEVERKSFAAAGELSIFFMEYHNTLRDESSQKFPRKYLQWGMPEGAKIVGKAIAIDPAISGKPDADFCTIAVAGMTQRGQIVVLDFDGKRGASPRWKIDRYFEMAARWNTNYHGVEANAYQAALVHLLREEMFRKRRYFEITPITHTMRKVERVEGILQPRYAGGYVWHLRPFALLESQLEDWPNGKLDGPDVVSMAVGLLDPYAAQASDDVEGLENDQFEPLEFESAI